MWKVIVRMTSTWSALRDEAWASLRRRLGITSLNTKLDSLQTKARLLVALNTDLQDAVDDIVATEGVVEQILTELVEKASHGGSVTDVEVQAAVDQINAARTKLSDAAVAADPTPDVPADPGA